MHRVDRGYWKIRPSKNLQWQKHRCKQYGFNNTCMTYDIGYNKAETEKNTWKCFIKTVHLLPDGNLNITIDQECLDETYISTVNIHIYRGRFVLFRIIVFSGHKSATLKPAKWLWWLFRVFAWRPFAPAHESTTPFMRRLLYVYKTWHKSATIHICDLDPIGRCSSQTKRILKNSMLFYLHVWMRK